MIVKLISLCLLTFTALIFGCTQSTGPDDSAQNEQPTVDDSPVQPQAPMQEEQIEVDLSLDPSTFNSNSMDKAVLTIQNNSGSGLGFGEKFWIEKENNGNWERSEKLSAIAFEDVGLEMEPGSSSQMNVNLTQGSISYEPGNYRLCKEFRAGSSTSTACTEFTVE